MDMLSVNKTQWGMWRLERANLTLVHSGEGRSYEVDLEAMNTTGQMLDWIFQVSGKSRATRQDVGELVQALDDIFHQKDLRETPAFRYGEERRFARRGRVPLEVSYYNGQFAFEPSKQWV
jgi:hypothetical protein